MIDELVQGFDAAVFCDLLNEKFAGTFSPVSKRIPVDKDLPWAAADQLGIVKSLPGPNDANMPLVVVAAELPEGEELRERSSRVKQFKFAKKVLDAAMSDPSPGVECLISQGLFIFYDDQGNFRLSLIYGKPEGTKLVWSAVRRQSFYVEAGDGNKTFRDRAALPWSTFDQLKDAFSVEKLTKEFYSRLFEWYQWALSDEMGVTYPNDTDTDEDDRQIGEHIIRLITRLMFVWFLKQKHLVPDELFDTGKLKRILKKFDAVSGDNYYRAILQNLFFATLNSEIPERAFATQTGDRTEHFDIKTLYRYPKEFAISESEVLELFKGIPFLNGGLFECLDRGRNYYDGFSRNRNRAAKVPNRLFFDQDDGLIPLLRQYNFTVEENSPGDEEVALDPELLGKVFENLLAAYNPETNVQARKATGSFYTPREIVNYMVDESLIAHLKARCGDEHEETIRKLFAEGTAPKDAKLCKAMDEGLVAAKILDPACGSGAFPMGMLLRMVDALRVLRGIPEDDPVYELKLQLIENCIYGADIQCIAVQISKLRFFISLVCEQKPTADANDNYGIHSLPNLETKFVAANSLIGLPHDGEMLPMQDVEALKKQLWSIRHRHFLARSYQEKKELRKEDRKLRTELAKALELGGGFDTASAKLMAEWDPYDQNTSATFLDPEWMFNVPNGFDAVIGNPPYVNVELVPADMKERYKQLYSTFYKRYDFFGMFYEAALLRFGSANAVVSFIVPQQIANNLSFSKLRDLMLDNAWVREVLYLGDKIFEAANNDVCVITLAKSGNDGIRLVYALDFDNREVTTVPHEYFKQYGNVISFGSDSGAEAIVQKMFAVEGWRLQQKFKVFQGIVTGNNEAFLPTPEQIRGASLESELLKPVLLGRDFEKWAIRSTARRILYVNGDTPIGDYPNTEKWLRQFKSSLKKRRECVRGVTPWYSLQWPREQSELNRVPKILVQGTRNPRLATRIVATMDDQCVYGTQGLNFIVPLKRDAPLHFLLAVLNSRLINYLYATKLLNVAIKAKYLKDTPIPVASAEDTDILSDLARRILQIKNRDPGADTSAPEQEVDAIVYRLYDLSPEDIAVVEEGAANVGKSSGRPKQKSPKAAGSKKKARRRRKADLPPSLPGWD